MGKITGWTKGELVRDFLFNYSLTYYNSLGSNLVISNVDDVEGWYVGVYHKSGRSKFIKKFKIKQQAKDNAMRYMKSHPKG